MMPKRRRANLPTREPSGRLSRATERAIGACSPGEVKRLRDAAARGMAAPEWGSELGRLFLTGRITSHLYEIGKRWARLSTAYSKVMGAPLNAQSATTLLVLGGKRDPDPESEEGRRQVLYDRRIVADMHEAHAVLIGAGKMAERAVRNLCESDEPLGSVYEHESLELGLTRLGQHWGLIANPNHV